MQNNNKEHPKNIRTRIGILFEVLVFFILIAFHVLNVCFLVWFACASIAVALALDNFKSDVLLFIILFFVDWFFVVFFNPLEDVVFVLLFFLILFCDDEVMNVIYE